MTRSLDLLVQDVRYGLRTLRNTPAFTTIAVLCLAVGIGANAAVFSWIESILLRPYPRVAAQERLVAIAGMNRATGAVDDLSWLDFEDLARSSSLFSAFIATKITGATITGGERPERIPGQMVSANFFDALGVRPVLGRGFLPDEETGANAHRVAVIGYALWQGRFAGDPSAIGRTISLDGVPVTIVGVAPEGFAGTFVGYAMRFWVTPSMQPVLSGAYTLDDRGARWIEGLARLAPGVTVAQAQAAMTVAARRLQLDHAELDRGQDVRVFPLWQAPFDYAKLLLPTLRIAVVVVLCVLLIACANVANLLLVRALGRRQEMTVRLALGAARHRLLRQLVTESALLAVLATIAGVLLAYWSRNALALFFSPRGGVGMHFAVEVDMRVLIASAAVGLLSTLGFAVVPALRGSRVDIAGALKADSRSSMGGAGTGMRLRSALVVGQVAISFVLLVGAGLLVTSLQRVRLADPGFIEDGVLTTGINLLSAGYDSVAARRFAERLLERAAALPGVDGAVLARTTPFDPGSPYAAAAIATDDYLPARDERPIADFDAVSPGYFAALGIPLRRGRDFTRADDDTTAPVAIVSETMAARYWPGLDPVGRRLAADGRWMQVVGVARDIRYENLLKTPGPLVYVPFRQQAPRRFAIHLRTRSGAARVGPALVALLRTLDPNLPTNELVPLGEQVRRSTATQEIAGALVGVSASLALALAALGLYGVISYIVSQGTRELALRMALGATPAQVLWRVLARGLTLAALGAAVGVALAGGTTRLLGDILYRVSPRDPAVFALCLAAMAILAAVASFIPSWRASRTNLVESLRV